MGSSEPFGRTPFQFCWLGEGPLPSALDLRRRGWTQDLDRTARCGCLGLINAGDLDSISWMGVLSSYSARDRRFIVVTGVKRAHERATLLQLGFGDALPEVLAIEELDARAGRVADAMNWLPRMRRIGTLQLDLLAREGYGNGRPLNLNPREFALLWRLTDSPNRTVSKQALIQDVWRMGFVPETNSIAVHMSRLRRKLGFAGLTGVIETASEGGYSLRIADEFGLPNNFRSDDIADADEERMSARL